MSTEATKLLHHSGAARAVLAILRACAASRTGLTGPGLSVVLAGRWARRTVYGALVRLRDQGRVTWDGTKRRGAKTWRAI